MSGDLETYHEAQDRRLREDMEIWNRAIEECARLMESYPGFSDDERRIAAAAIRALKDKS